MEPAGAERIDRARRVSERGRANQWNRREPSDIDEVRRVSERERANQWSQRETRGGQGEIRKPDSVASN